MVILAVRGKTRPDHSLLKHLLMTILDRGGMGGMDRTLPMPAQYVHGDLNNIITVLENEADTSRNCDENHLYKMGVGS